MPAEKEPFEERAAIVITLGRDEVQQMYKSVDFHLNSWPQYVLLQNPPQPDQERNRLLAIKQFLSVAMMEFSFHSPSN